jgi:hypothetical protein
MNTSRVPQISRQSVTTLAHPSARLCTPPVIPLSDQDPDGDPMNALRPTRRTTARAMTLGWKGLILTLSNFVCVAAAVTGVVAALMSNLLACGLCVVITFGAHLIARLIERSAARRARARAAGVMFV